MRTLPDDQSTEAVPRESRQTPPHPATLVVYYDGGCPRCRRDRKRYERWAGAAAATVTWFDITGQEQALRSLGIDPHQALTRLHVCDQQGHLYVELDAYARLMEPIPWLRPLAWLISSPLVRPWLSKLYRASVKRRLRRQGRLG